MLAGSVCFGTCADEDAESIRPDASVLIDTYKPYTSTSF